ncbi:hypothetical protein [uncultured Pseudacidovorax sp.]|uniref:hypothetical protein n=1 Tax=uncultured Pseudacidovorax sp. TaxID=679313 RepID=UPI0025F7C205|nr:hypothetical protein [uncultured Pseudacidovorax sp.]
MSTAKTFSALFRRHLDTMAAELNRKTDADISVEYGTTDEGREWALFVMDATPLGTVFAHAGSSGGHIVIDATGRHCIGSPAGTLDSVRLVRTARKQVKAAYTAMAA